MRSRSLVLLVAVTLAAGCGSANGGGRGRAVAAGVLGGLAVLAGAGAAGAAKVSADKEKKLEEDLARGGLTGKQFVERDDEGKRWNRTARGAAFVSGLAVVGMILVWESSLAAHYQSGPSETPQGQRLIPGAAPSATPPSAALLPAPGSLRGAPANRGVASAQRAQRSTSAR